MVGQRAVSIGGGAWIIYNTSNFGWYGHCFQKISCATLLFSIEYVMITFEFTFHSLNMLPIYPIMDVALWETVYQKKWLSNCHFELSLVSLMKCDGQRNVLVLFSIHKLLCVCVCIYGFIDYKSTRSLIISIFIYIYMYKCTIHPTSIAISAEVEYPSFFYRLQTCKM